MTKSENQTTGEQCEPNHKDARAFSASRRSRRRIHPPTFTAFSASDFAMTGATSPAITERQSDRPIPYFGTDDPIPFDLARGEGMSVWGGGE